jgi:thiamine kinase-like enzyme
LVKSLDELPQTFCHQDAFTQNIFYRKGKFVAIDWGYAGIAPVGAELAALIGVAFEFSKFPSTRAEELDQVCFENYLHGLRDAGFEPDRKQVRLGFILTMTLRYVLGGVVGETLPWVLDEQRRKNYSEAIGVSEDEASKSDPGVVKYYQRITMEALQSMGLGFIIRFIARTILWAIRFAAQRIKFSKS